jgi:hypothetical protein
MFPTSEAAGGVESPMTACQDSVLSGFIDAWRACRSACAATERFGTSYESTGDTFVQLSSVPDFDEMSPSLQVNEIQSAKNSEERAIHSM